MRRRYLRAVRRQAECVRDALGEARFARLAIGGGTPTFLDAGELESLLRIAPEVMGVELGRIPASVEASPSTVTPEKLSLLRDGGANRLSIGVQSFDAAAAAAMGRPHRPRQVDAALTTIRDAGFPVMNIDLIYGGPGQTPDGFLADVRRALCFRPEEMFLYPLYVRPLTGLAARRGEWVDRRLEIYRAARDLLCGEGYRQISMRMFRAPGGAAVNEPAYCCQRDGMVALGCGPRSYTKRLHYSGEYAVRRRAAGEIIRRYVNRDAASFAVADHGIRLGRDDRCRRFVLQSLLQCPGLDRRDYQREFGGDVFDDLPQLTHLADRGVAEIAPGRIRLTAGGVEMSDAIGPWLYSDRVRRLMEAYQWR